MVFDNETDFAAACYSDELAWAVPDNIKALEHFVEGIRASVRESVYSKAFTKAFHYFRHTSTTEGRGKKNRIFL